jgi:hypothetical protein
MTESRTSWRETHRRRRPPLTFEPSNGQNGVPPRPHVCLSQHRRSFCAYCSNAALSPYPSPAFLAARAFARVCVGAGVGWVARVSGCAGRSCVTRRTWTRHRPACARPALTPRPHTRWSALPQRQLLRDPPAATPGQRLRARRRPTAAGARATAGRGHPSRSLGCRGKPGLARAPRAMSAPPAWCAATAGLPVLPRCLFSRRRCAGDFTLLSGPCCALLW